MPYAWKIQSNPSDPDQYYMLWTNGRIEPGGANPPPAITTSPFTQYSAGTAPLWDDIWDNSYMARGFQIVDWSTFSGYVIDLFGNIFNLNDATAVPSVSQPVTQTYPYDNYQDFVMNPAGDGQGYALAGNGSVPNIGGSPNIGGTTEFPGDDTARRIYMPDWATKKYVTLDGYGRRFSRHSAVDIYATLPTGGEFAPSQILHNGNIASACAFYEDFNGGAGHQGKGWALAAFGWIHSLGPTGAEAQDVYGNPTHEGWAYSSDLDIIDDGTGSGPLHLRVLNIYGGVEEFFVSTAPSVIVQSPDDTTNTTRPTVGWVYSDTEGDAQQEVLIKVFNDSQYPTGTNEVQRVTITGSPTGGTFKLSFKGSLTTAIAYNATAGIVDSALEALPTIGAGDVTCTGGPLPGSFVVCTFGFDLGGENLPQMTAVSSLTGGASPAVTVTTTTAGAATGFDPLTTTFVPIYENNIVMPEGRAARTDQIDVDLVNDTYRVYVWVMDSSGLVSSYDFKGWTQNVVPPATPTMTLTQGEPLSGTLIGLTAASVTTGGVYVVEYRDSESDTWRYVRGADALVPDGSRNASVFDREYVFGVERSYRTRQLVPDPILVGAYSAEQALTVASSDWVLTDIDSTAGLIASVRDFDFDRKIVAGTFWPEGRREAVVITGSLPAKSLTATLQLRTLNSAEYTTLETLINAGHTLLLRDPFSRHAYVAISDTISYTQLRARPHPDEDYPTRHAHEIDIPVVEVTRPLAGPSSGSLALL